MGPFDEMFDFNRDGKLDAFEEGAKWMALDEIFNDESEDDDSDWDDDDEF